MRIGINLIPLRPGQMGGHEFYVRSLLEQLLARDHKNQYFLFTAWWNDQFIDFPMGRSRKVLAIQTQESRQGGEDGFPPPGSWLSNWHRHLRNLPLVNSFGTPPPMDLHSWVRHLRLDLWFCPITNLDPRHLPIPTVTTIADIQQEFYPEFFTREELNHRALMYLPSCQEATAVITVSQAAKQSLIEKYKLPEEKVHCVYEAGIRRRSELSPTPSLDQVRQKYRLPGVYAFYPANMWPHKNHLMLILALHRLQKIYGVALPLVLTGDDLGQWPRIEEIARHFRLQEQVHYLGYVPAEDLPPLYAGASMLLFPSLFEGFGLPLLEAMELGCPVAAANLTSIPEIVGDAALLFDPRDPDAIADACHQLLGSEDLRQTLVAHGRERLRQFSWEKAADETLQVFEWARAQHPAPQRAFASPPQRARIEGVYPDGWTTRRVRLYLPYIPEMRAIKVEGRSAHLSYPLALRMKVNRRRVQELPVTGPGTFALVGELNGGRRAMTGVDVEILADQEFVPADVENSVDTRQLAYRIDKLSLLRVDGVEIPVYAP